jgi:hypothetical protein
MKLRVRLGLFGVALVSSMLAACTALKDPNDRSVDGGFHGADLGLDAATDSGLDTGTACAAIDVDGDGESSCTDCDDNDASRYHGATEICDGDDEDCDPTTFGPDVDSDGFVSIACCNLQGDGTLACGNDCDDANSSIDPGATEICDDADNDCDGAIDEGVCVPCGAGYTGFDGSCADIDECALGACGANAGGCANSVGSYSCMCNTGYGAPATGGTCARFTDLLDGTVRDNANGAVWQQAEDPATYTQAGAIAYCAGFALDGGGWRLPTKDELLSIVDTRFSPTIDPAYFPGTLVFWFWTSSAIAGSPSNGWVVFFDYGVAGSGVVSEAGRARCVR